MPVGKAHRSLEPERRLHPRPYVLGAVREEDDLPPVRESVLGQEHERPPTRLVRVVHLGCVLPAGRATRILLVYFLVYTRLYHVQCLRAWGAPPPASSSVGTERKWKCPGQIRDYLPGHLDEYYENRLHWFSAATNLTRDSIPTHGRFVHPISDVFAKFACSKPPFRAERQRKRPSGTKTRPRGQRIRPPGPVRLPPPWLP